ncbi:MAG TPA: bifunctional 4-hydroxy-2-oxoglutarate aldolase/2-dehydro-3-deoxy-phosphogluconate aldolase [Steroidobacteraceae bacterium]|jgi:2-dehydro-3-deoxyphosphogluconate aldolase/(4S)-4-hydroxy-2-oxoglutarate aldolase|nr:bifunctional 4-hydroxy-2-oxoglutarate aldolase/2-dehydro-3-deoxy-phosphogluconate aldolase [Steroidobacteraceae bacterium]
MNIREIVDMAPVIPVLTVSDLAHAVPLARALVAGGLRVLEVTLRTSVAIGCIEAIRKGVPDAVVGVGTLTRPKDFAAADRAGAQFGVTPGLTPELAGAARGARFPLLPGVMTPTEMIAARNSGFNILKLFPAQQAGGVAMLRAVAALFPDLLFCPTGGITRASAQEYLALPNVVCVGGSWIAPQELLDAGNWQGIETLAREAVALNRR